MTNEKMFEDLKLILSPNTRLCIAADISLKTEYIKTYTVQAWKKIKPNLQPLSFANKGVGLYQIC